MTYAILRIVIFVIIGLAIFLGIRRIWRDWKGEYKAVDKAKRERDLKERARPDVITLKRDKDGTFRPGDDPDKR
jgi:hypothetical protein